MSDPQQLHDSLQLQTCFPSCVFLNYLSYNRAGADTHYEANFYQDQRFHCFNNLLLLTSVSIYSILFYPITLEGRRGTTDEFATIPFHLDLFSAALVELAKSIPVHSLILSSHLFFCLPLFLFPFLCWFRGKNRPDVFLCVT